MKILVDEMPKNSDRCIFEFSYEECVLNPNEYCFEAFNVKCPYLKPLEQPIKDDCK